MIFRTVFLALAALGLVLGTSACDDDAGPQAARAATAAECRVVKNGTVMTSPISGKSITKQSTTPAALWENKLYFFCCEVDRDKFLQQPSTFSQGVLPPNAHVVDLQ